MPGGTYRSFAEWLVEHINQELQKIGIDGWQIEIKHHNSKHCGLPQWRPRVFFVGTSSAMRLNNLYFRVWNVLVLAGCLNLKCFTFCNIHNNF